MDAIFFFGVVVLVISLIIAGVMNRMDKARMITVANATQAAAYVDGDVNLSFKDDAYKYSTTQKIATSTSVRRNDGHGGGGYGFSGGAGGGSYHGDGSYGNRPGGGSFGGGISYGHRPSGGSYSHRPSGRPGGSGGHGASGRW